MTLFGSGKCTVLWEDVTRLSSWGEAFGGKLFRPRLKDREDLARKRRGWDEMKDISDRRTASMKALQQPRG